VNSDTAPHMMWMRTTAARCRI